MSLNPRSRERRADADRGAATAVGVGLGVLVLLLGLLVSMTVMGGGGSGAACAPSDAAAGSSTSDQPDPSAEGEGDIPEDMLEVYRQVARETNVPWNILAGVGKVESDHGRDPRSEEVNHAGAAGPMQIGVSDDLAAGNTWSTPVPGDTRIRVADFGHETFWDDTSRRHGQQGGGWRPFAADGDDDGYYDVHDPWDAVMGAAGYLLYLGVQDDAEQALSYYNMGTTYRERTSGYSDRVMEHAARYADGDFEVGRAAVGAGGDGGARGARGASRGNCGSGTSLANLAVEPQDFEVADLVDLPPAECAVPGAVGGIQQITPLTCAAHKVVYDRFEDGIFLVHAGRCPSDGYEHPLGQAMDYMINNGGTMPSPEQKANGDAIAAWVMTNHQVLGVYYIIWNNRVWFPREGVMDLAEWRGYGGSGPTDGHYDHVHVSWVGPRVSTC
jgi:hypothetical protein